MKSVDIYQCTRATLQKDTGSLDVPIEAQRRQWEESASKIPLSDKVSTTAQRIAGVDCEWVSGPSVREDTILLWLHGGGFYAGSCITHREFAARLSTAASVSVLLVDYSLAPEHPFPAGLEDVLKVYRSLLTTDFDKKRIFIGGDSAGGGLALSSMLALRSTHDPLPAAAILLSPWVDLMLRGETLASRELLDPLVSEAGLRLAAELYRGNHPLDDPLLSPIDADLEGLPPLLIHVGDHEILLSDSLRLAENARKAKVDVEMKLWPKLWHFFHAWDELPETKVSLHEIARFLQQNFIDK